MNGVDNISKSYISVETEIARTLENPSLTKNSTGTFLTTAKLLIAQNTT
jgi:hypothetical protein